jgi:hypothetical protein
MSSRRGFGGELGDGGFVDFHKRKNEKMDEYSFRWIDLPINEKWINRATIP